MRTLSSRLMTALVVLCVLAAAPVVHAAGPVTGDYVVFQTSVGSFTLRLYPKDAPRTVQNFRRLVANGFYDSLTFHRIVPDFVVQGGDPNSRNENPFDDGRGDPGYTIPAEISRKHLRGAVAMARKPDAVNPERASNGSQFYIALRDLPFLDGQYTVFGAVVSGWSTIEALAKLAERRDIARVGNDANPGRLALILSARLTDRAPAPSVQGKAPRDTTTGGGPADSTSN